MKTGLRLTRDVFDCAALSGTSFVLRGPPGCGKTQTLANMAAALTVRARPQPLFS